MINVFDFASTEERDDGRAWYAINPDTMYPAMIAHVVDAIAGPSPDGALHQEWSAAKRIPARAFEWALIPRDKFADDDERLPAREAALEIARRWYTQMLHVAVGKPIGVHILKGSDAWRL